MSQIIPIYIPTYISDQNYNPSRVLPRLLFYNGMVDSQEWYIESGSTTAGGTGFAQNAFPYFDNYNVVAGSFPTTDSKSLLFFNEPAVYGETPIESLYTNYWETYVELLYNPRTRLLNASAIIPLADYFKMELNDIVEFRGNYYHLRAINDYNLKNGECQLQLLGPILGAASPAAETTTTTTTLPPCVFNGVTIVCESPTTTTTTTIPPCPLSIEYLVVGGGGGGGNNSSNAGGGGGGQFIASASIENGPFSYNVTIGEGGISGSNGEATLLNTITAIGGGGGGGYGQNGSNGANGGGAGEGQPGSDSYGGFPTAPDGNTGGFARGGSGGLGASGGGAGANGNGGNACCGILTWAAGNGGAGKLWSPNSTHYAGGGGGGNSWFNGIATGGIGGGGNGVNGGASPDIPSTAGTPNTGGGGGGGRARGGSGIVIIRYVGTPVATGGTITQSGGYTYHTFTTGSSNFVYDCSIPTTTTTTAAPTTTTTTTLGPYAVGQYRDGGYVFYVEGTSPNQTGLIVAPINTAANVAWGCEGTLIAGANGRAIGTGQSNTTAILNACATRPIAASVADSYVNDGWADWYLPSRNELETIVQLYLSGSNVGEFSVALNRYYTSTQSTGSSSGYQGNGNPATQCDVAILQPSQPAPNAYYFFNQAKNYGGGGASDATFVKPIRTFGPGQTTTTTTLPACTTWSIYGGSTTGATILVSYINCAGASTSLRVNRNQTTVICVQYGTTPTKTSGTGNNSITSIGNVC